MKLFSSFLLLVPFFSLAIGVPVLSRDLNSFLAEIALLMPFSGAIDAVTNLIIAAENTLALDFNIATTQNGLKGKKCTPVTVIFARGTSEPGNVGVVAGPPFFDALKSRIGAGDVAIQGVAYQASVEGFLVGGDAGGAQTMANLVQQAYSQCPDTQVIMAGYSQGGQVLHKAAALLPTSIMEEISSVIIFGDPDNGSAVANVPSGRTLVICHVDDDICLHGDLILLPHLTYAADSEQAADFVASQAGY